MKYRVGVRCADGDDFSTVFESDSLPSAELISGAIQLAFESLSVVSEVAIIHEDGMRHVPVVGPPTDLGDLPSESRRCMKCDGPICYVRGRGWQHED